MLGLTSVGACWEVIEARSVRQRHANRKSSNEDGLMSWLMK
jgi:hypothetical protein